MNKELIKNKETFFVLINLIVYKSYLSFPGKFIRDGASGGALTSLLGAVISYILICALISVYKKTEEENVIDILNNRLFKGGGETFGILVIIYLIISASFCLYEVVSFSEVSAYPKAPFMFIALFFIISGGVSSLCGIKAVKRVHVTIVPFSIFIMGIMTFFAFRSFDVDNLFPILGNGGKNLFFSGLKNISYYLDFVILFFINPFKEENISVKGLKFSAATGIIINFLVVLIINLVIPYEVSGEISFPVYQLVKNVYPGRFFQRMDAFYLIAAALSAMGYLAYVISVIITFFERIFPQKRKGFIVFFSCILIFILSMTPYRVIWSGYLVIIAFILIFVPLVKRRKMKP